MGVVGDNARGPNKKSFFASFCSQKEVLPCLSAKLTRTAQKTSMIKR
jgi:hypothetical protein